MSTEDVFFYRLDVHYLNHHTNGQLRIYGNQLLAIVPPAPDEHGLHITYEVTPTEVNFLGEGDERCNTEQYLDGKIDIQKCLEQYIASRMECIIPWLANNLSQDKESLCQYPKEYATYVSLLYDEVFKFDIGSIARIANCTPSCTRHEYSLKRMADYRVNWDNSTTVHFFYGKDRFTVKQQYYTYDFQNFLADFGGYLGLLLGYSILGIYDTLVKLVYNK